MSSSEYNRIKSVASTAKSAKTTLSSANSSYEREANNLKSNWKGEMGAAFADSYKKIKGNVSRLISDTGSLNSKLNSLASAVQRAENEEARNKAKSGAGRNF